MSGNRKGWRWCKGCRQWVMAFPFVVGGMCDQCELKQLENWRREEEYKDSAEYLERDYAQAC